MGGVPSIVFASVDAYVATATGLTASGVPTSLPLDATKLTAVSAFLATVTEVPNLGSPADLSSYPKCAVSLRMVLLEGSLGADIR